MNYDMQKLLTVDECTRLLTAVNLDKDSLTAQKISLNKRLSSTSSMTISEDIAAAQNDVTYYTGFTETLPNGERKEYFENQLRKAVTKVYTLNQRLKNFGIVSQLQTALEYNGTDKSIAEADLLIAAVTARQAELA